MVKAIPEGYHSVTPYLIIKGAGDALEFYKKGLNAKEILRVPGPNGEVMHAEIKIGDSFIMLADECPEKKFVSPQTLGGSPIIIHLYVTNVDVLTKQAIAAGAKVLQPVKDQFYGDRSGSVIDPFGHIWNISTHVEDVSPEEIDRRMAAMRG